MSFLVLGTDINTNIPYQWLLTFLGVLKIFLWGASIIWSYSGVLKLKVYEKSMEIVNQGNGMEALIVDKSKGLLVLKNKRKEE